MDSLDDYTNQLLLELRIKILGSPGQVNNNGDQQSQLCDDSWPSIPLLEASAHTRIVGEMMSMNSDKEI